jgi:membrane associated rhomboid family serine protease
MFKLLTTRQLQFQKKIGQDLINIHAKKASKGFFKTNKKKFSNGFGSMFSQPLPVIKYILYGNCFIYGLSFFMNYNDYIKNIFYHPLALNHGKFQTLVTCHFAKKNFLELSLDSLIVYLIGNQLELMLGSQVFLRLMLASVGFGSILLVLFHKQNYFTRTDTILRGMIMYFVLQNPNQTFILFPLPFNVQAKFLGMFIVGLDLLTGKYANFGGTIAAYALLRGII